MISIILGGVPEKGITKIYSSFAGKVFGTFTGITRRRAGSGLLGISGG
jgi:hypothetical protein